jgi:HSP20 family protein
MAVVGDPLHSLRPLREEEINQLSSNRAQHGTHPLAYDVYRAGDQLVIEFDAPGAAPSDLAVAIEGRTIVVSVHRKLANGAGIDVIEAGREHGTFQQRLWLGEGWDLERLHARSENGVLYVHAPVSAGVTTRPVEVAAGSGAPVGGAAQVVTNSPQEAGDPVAAGTGIRPVHTAA